MTSDISVGVVSGNEIEQNPRLCLSRVSSQRREKSNAMADVTKELANLLHFEEVIAWSPLSSFLLISQFGFTTNYSSSDSALTFAYK